MRLLKILIISIYIIPNISFAVEYFSKGKSPFDLKRAGNPYGRGNNYLNTSPNNPYSKYRSIYDPKSVRNDVRYATPVKSPQGKYHGNLSVSPYGKDSALNPYNKYGNPYSKDNETYLYQTDSDENPYGQFRDPYNPKSVSNSPEFGIQTRGRRGKFHGTIDNLPYHSKSILNPYSKYGNPYSKRSIRNPYRGIQEPEK